MRSCFFTFVCLLLFSTVSAQKKIIIDSSLHGEWFNMDNGNFQYAFYDKNAIYRETVWYYDDVSKQGKKIEIKLHNRNGEAILLKIKEDRKRTIIESSNKEKGKYSRRLKDCKVQHNLPAYTAPVIGNDTVYFSGYVYNRRPQDSTINVSSYNFINRMLGMYKDEFSTKIDLDGYFSLKLPVIRPGIIEINVANTPDYIYVEPGKKLFVIYEHGFPIYGGEGGLLARENFPFNWNYKYLLDPINYPNKLKGLTPEKFKDFFLTEQKEEQAYLDSINVSGSISPRTYQMQRLNIQYFTAASLCDYYSIMEQLGFSSGNPRQLRTSYLDFLKHVEVNDVSPVAPNYGRLVRTINQGIASLDTLPNIKSVPPTMDSLAFYLHSLKKISEVVDTSDIDFIDLIVRITPDERKRLLEAQKERCEEFIGKYGYLMEFQKIFPQDKKGIEYISHIDNGLFWDVALNTQIISQYAIKKVKLPQEFFFGKTSLFSNDFVAKYLYDYYKKEMSNNTIVNKPIVQNEPSFYRDWNYISPVGIVSRDTITKNGLTLIWINKFDGFNSATKNKMTEVFFKVYPEEMRLYNINAPKKVIFVIDPEYIGVAASSNNLTRYNPQWFLGNPTDFDVVTHEVMHIVQAYTKNQYQPSWVTEGIADYVRYTLGIYNKEANWYWPEYQSGQSYLSSYRITARFFYWLEIKKNKGIIQTLDAAMRNGTYNENFWKNNLGKTVGELWTEYSQNSKLD
ncbi:MAG: hypothetical protein DI598_02835 [Pseudopedobacter saltans]|uniref:Secretory protein n=1 Tax=Pseudopedobacter saltans TaxID=151895 RepID=A0A2W5H0K3_9SPHI|nr:MAG: hypothetical protein DI598_02835 [Pseudopedobacter saltans]